MKAATEKVQYNAISRRNTNYSSYSHLRPSAPHQVAIPALRESSPYTDSRHPASAWAPCALGDDVIKFAVSDDFPHRGRIQASRMCRLQETQACCLFAQRPRPLSVVFGTAH